MTDSFSSDQQAVLDDLLKEKNLSAIYKESRKIPFSKSNIFAGLFVWGIVTYHSSMTSNFDSIANQLLSLASIAFSTSIGLLGFLLAGFSFFATIFDKSLFFQMAKISHDKSGLSYLKYNFFTFMRVFCEYLVFSIISLLLIAFCQNNSFCRQWIFDTLSNMNWHHRLRFLAAPDIFCISMIFGLFCGSFVYLIMQLKSFIFNIYHVVMTNIRWSLEEAYLEQNKTSAKEKVMKEEQ